MCHKTILVVIKRQLFTFIFAVFLPQSTAVIPLFRFSKQMAAMWNYTSRFDFGPDIVTSMRFGTTAPAYKFYPMEL